jgi:hypothetical protein
MKILTTPMKRMKLLLRRRRRMMMTRRNLLLMLLPQLKTTKKLKAKMSKARTVLQASSTVIPMSLEIFKAIKRL